MASDVRERVPTFDDLVFQQREVNRQATVFFSNGYGASVVIGPWTYGGDEGKYELGVVKGNQSGWQLCYSTPVADDVIGHLTPEDVTTRLAEIAALPAPLPQGAQP